MMNSNLEVDFQENIPSSFQAEKEPWLPTVYVFPKLMKEYAEARSAIFFTKPGAGSTALRLMMTRMILQEGQGKSLIINWIPEAHIESKEPLQSSEDSIQQMMRAWVAALFQAIIQQPERIRVAPEWVLQGMSYLMETYLPIDPYMYLLEIDPSTPDQGEYLKAAERLINTPPRPLFRAGITRQNILRLFVQFSNWFGFTSIWVMIDDLGKWPTHLQNSSQALLTELLDTLAYFEIPSLYYKVFALDQDKNLYSRLGGVDKLRLMPYDVTWVKEELIAIVKNHFGYALNQPTFQLTDITNDSAWLEWLEQYGGAQPRMWLYLARPFIQAWRNSSIDAKFSWREIARNNPPPLCIDSAIRQVLLGELPVKTSPSEYEILNYLYQHRGEICSKEEIYYRVLQGKDVPDDVDLRGARQYWEGAFDNIIYRIRKQIEEKPDEPIYLITVRGKGITLKNVW